MAQQGEVVPRPKPNRYRVQAEVVGSAALPGDHRRLTLRAPEIAAAAVPGQFLQVWCHPPQDLDRPPVAAVLRRPLSISQVHASGEVEVLLRVRGTGGVLLSRKVVGDVLDLIGPLGHGFETGPELRVAAIVAGGIGLAPVPSLVSRLVAQGVFAGATQDERLPYAVTRVAGARPTLPELEALGAEVEYTSEEVEGNVVGELLHARLIEFTGPGCGLFAIGPRAMMHSVYEIVGDRSPLQVSLEERMACGVGACRSCVVPIVGPDGPTYLTACREGPVFYAHQVDWGRLT